MPPVEILPPQENPEPSDGPDEGGDERDFPLPPEVEPMVQSEEPNQSVADASSNDVSGTDASVGGDSGGEDD